MQMRLMRIGAILVSAFALAAATTAQAQQKVQIGCTATSDCASAMIAIDEGIFKRLGLDAEMVLIGINSNIPAALLSNSIQIGGPTTPVFLQAADGGLDLVAVAGASIINERTSNLTTGFVRTGVNVKEAKDFVGKKVGAPGLGAFLHVLFVRWLAEKGVDPKSVNFVEVSFPTMNDILKSGAVDAVLTSEPFVTRMTNAGTGYAAVRYVADLKRTEPIIFYAAASSGKESGDHQEVPGRNRRRLKIVNSDRERRRRRRSRGNSPSSRWEIVKLNPRNCSEPRSRRRISPVLMESI
ncbi:MAG: ABC transporter substrate-binding protein [Xanthobacteraceae bacterium]